MSIRFIWCGYAVKTLLITSLRHIINKPCYQKYRRGTGCESCSFISSRKYILVSTFVEVPCHTPTSKAISVFDSTLLHKKARVERHSSSAANFFLRNSGVALKTLQLFFPFIVAFRCCENYRFIKGSTCFVLCFSSTTAVLSLLL